MNEARSDYGFPILDPKYNMAVRLGRARHEAALIRERNKPECDCEGCKIARGLPMVQRLLANWKPLQKFNDVFL